MARLRRALEALEGHWLGEVLAVLSLFAIPVLVMFAGLVLGCPE